MSGLITKKMIEAYFQDATPTMFLTSFFRSPPANFHNSEEVEIDIMRGTEKVAIVVQDLAAGYRMNTLDDYTNKSFKPPVLKEAFPIKASDLIKREVGAHPFEDREFQANVQVRAFRGFRQMEGLICRNMELQGSQVLTTGILTLVDTAGTALYTLDYKPKATHFPTASNAWGGGSATPIADLTSLAQVIRSDGRNQSGRFNLIFGGKSWDTFIADANVQKYLDLRHFDPGVIAMRDREGGGGIYNGTLNINAYSFNLWLYPERYDHPQTGTSTAYVPDDKVIMIAEGARFDATFGAVPRLVPPDSRVLPFMPGRMSHAGRRMDLWTNAWVTPDGENLFGGVASRPLMIPTAIDQYGCLDTGV